MILTQPSGLEYVTHLLCCVVFRYTSFYHVLQVFFLCTSRQILFLLSESLLKVVELACILLSQLEHMVSLLTQCEVHSVESD